MVRTFLLSVLLLGAQALSWAAPGDTPVVLPVYHGEAASRTPARADSRDAIAAAMQTAIFTWRDPNAAAGGSAWLCFTSEAASRQRTDTTAQIRQTREQFVKLVKLGRLERFDDAKHLVLFKRNGQEGAAHDPGPLEDEATAAAARNALAPEYAKGRLKLKLTCSAGNVTINELPDDGAQAAVALNHVLALDGVRTISASLPPSLCLP